MQHTRRSFLKATGTAATIGTASGWAQRGARSAARPNILVLMCDQMHWKMMSAAGNRWVKTPGLDGLCHSGVRFERAYSANPVCMPARFAMLTGRYPSVAGISENASRPPAAVVNPYADQAMGHLVRAAGYETLYGGKVHLPGRLGNVVNDGFDSYFSKDEREELAAETIKFIRRPHSKPFFMVSSFINPHDICYMAIKDYAESPEGRAEAARRAFGRGGGEVNLERAMVEVQTMEAARQLPQSVPESEFYARYCPPAPDNFEIPKLEPDGIEWMVKEQPFREHARKTWNGAKWRLHRWTYARLMERADALIAQVLTALHETGLDENTVVIFTSDHGDHDGAHRLEHKSTHYEESVRVPMIVRAPGMAKAGSVLSEPLVCTGLDLLPTICDYAGVDVPAGLQGKSLRPFVEGKPSGNLRDTVYSETKMGYMVADHRYKYCAFDPDKSSDGHTNTPRIRESLVDTQKDPGEMHNLAFDAQQKATVSRLRKAMGDWMERNGVKFQMPA